MRVCFRHYLKINISMIMERRNGLNGRDITGRMTKTEDAYKDIDAVVDLYRIALGVEKTTQKKLEKEESSAKGWEKEKLAADQTLCIETQKQLRKRILMLESAARKRNVLLAGRYRNRANRERMGQRSLAVCLQEWSH